MPDHTIFRVFICIIPKKARLPVSTLFISIVSIYLFIVVGFMAKRIFRERMDERTITLLSVYFLQPFLNFWGLMRTPIDASLVYAPVIYTIIVLIVLAGTFLLGRQLFADLKERSLFIISGIIGNTANLGIPIGIAVFGEESIPYTTVINIANVFLVYTLGVYFYSRGNFSVRESVLNILKLPVLWFALLAIIFNLTGITLLPEIDRALEMGAYASIVIQLILFGIYLYSVQPKSINLTLLAGVGSVKFLALPLVSAAVLSVIDLPPMVKGVLFLEMIMPLAIANVNLAALYDCRPKDVTALILVTTVLFMGILFGAVELIGRFGWM